MKSVIRYMCMIAMVALAFTSCNKNESKKTTFTARTQKLVYESGMDRTYIGTDDLVHFEAGDVCMVFNINETNASQSHCATYEALEEGSVVTFQNCGLGEVAEERLDAFYAYYPGGVGMVETLLGDGENKIKLFISPEQEYRQDMIPANSLPMAAKVENVDHLGDADFDFQNLFGVLQLKPYEVASRTITKIEVVDNMFNLSGWMTLNINSMEKSHNEFADAVDSNEPSGSETGLTSLSRDNANSITLSIPGGVQLGTTKESTPVFNIVLRPLALSQGCHIKVTFNDGNVKDVDISDQNLLTIKPNYVKPVSINLDNY